MATVEPFATLHYTCPDGDKVDLPLRCGRGESEALILAQMLVWMHTCTHAQIVQSFSISD